MTEQPALPKAVTVAIDKLLYQSHGHGEEDDELDARAALEAEILKIVQERDDARAKFVNLMLQQTAQKIAPDVSTMAVRGGTLFARPGSGGE